MLEIERKFLIKNIPFALDDYPHKDILQGYLKDEEGKRWRIRQKGNKYYKTYKIGTGLVREEIETEITKDEFDTKRALVEEKFLKKIRYEIPYDKYIIELDIFTGKLEGLIFAEIEFPSEEAANALVIPEWFDEELTYDEEAKNSYLAKYGIPLTLKALLD